MAIEDSVRNKQQINVGCRAECLRNAMAGEKDNFHLLIITASPGRASVFLTKWGVICVILPEPSMYFNSQIFSLSINPYSMLN